jgi:hypothetical protein
LTKILKPSEVDELGHVPYMCILKFPEIEKQFGSEALAELKFRLQTNDFGGVRGTKAFDRLLEEMAKERLELGATAPDIPEIIDAEEIIDDDTPREVINPCEVVETDPNFDDSDDDEDEAPNPVEALLASRVRASNTKLSESAGSKSERKRQAEIAFSQAKRCLQKIRDSYGRIGDGILEMLQRVWDQEDFIIGDSEVDALYRELLSDFADIHRRALNVVLTFQKELREHGQSLEQVQMPEGATTASLFDQQT